jgi:hypothetical protein
MANRVDVEVGFAAGERGHGIAYARIHRDGAEHLLRVTFRLRPEFRERETGYAALTSVIQALGKRGLRRVRLAVDDVELVHELAGAEVPEAMVLPYVRLKCALNRLDDVKVSAAQSGDLSQRARAEVALNPAA